MTTSMKFAALALLGATLAAPAFAADAAKVNGTAIPQARLDLRIKAATAQGQPDSPELRKAIREDLINLEVMSQETVKLGLDKNSEIEQQLAIARQSILAGAFVQDYAKKHPISEATIKQEYETLKARLGDKEYNARHILVASEAEAKDLIAQLDKKAKFDKLAAKSLDAGSKENGGSLGWAVPGNFVQPFAQAMVALKKGEYTKEPVQSQFGWHVIKVDDVRALKVPTFNEIKPQLQQRLQQQEIQKAINELRTTAKIE